MPQNVWHHLWTFPYWHASSWPCLVSMSALTRVVFPYCQQHPYPSCGAGLLHDQSLLWCYLFWGGNPHSWYHIVPTPGHCWHRLVILFIMLPNQVYSRDCDQLYMLMVRAGDTSCMNRLGTFLNFNTVLMSLCVVLMHYKSIHVGSQSGWIVYTAGYVSWKCYMNIMTIYAWY